MPLKSYLHLERFSLFGDFLPISRKKSLVIKLLKKCYLRFNHSLRTLEIEIFNKNYDYITPNKIAPRVTLSAC
jgi:hypothetical protein